MASRRRRRRDPRPLRDALAAWRRRAGAPADPGPLGAVRVALIELGERPERMTPIRLSRAGVLTVACADAGEAQALAARAERVRDDLARELPEAGVRAVRAVVADHALAPEPERRPPPAPPEPSHEEIERAERIAGGVADPRLRELIARGAAARIAMQRGDGGDRGSGFGGGG